MPLAPASTLASTTIYRVSAAGNLPDVESCLDPSARDRRPPGTLYPLRLYDKSYSDITIQLLANLILTVEALCQNGPRCYHKRVRWAPRWIVIAAVVVVSVAVSGWASNGASAHHAGPSATTGYSITGVLASVAATSASNAWAVGLNGSPSGPNGPEGTTLIVHWNGKSWSRVTNPRPVKGYLLSVAAVSATDAWAVGTTPGGKCAACGATLIMHWNGKSWERYANAPAISGYLLVVTASKYGVWAAGTATAGDIGTGLILRLIGTRWYVVPSPYPANFEGIAVTGRKSVWADALENGAGLLMHWNGKNWKSFSFPVHGYSVWPGAMAAGPHGAVMMIGTRYATSNSSQATYSAAFNGETWKLLPAPAVGTLLYGVTFIPGKGAWAAGVASTGPTSTSPEVLRWNGHAWIAVRKLTGLPDVSLDALGGVSASDAWAVGSAQAPGATDPTTVILHWNGHSLS